MMNKNNSKTKSLLTIFIVYLIACVTLIGVIGRTARAAENNSSKTPTCEQVIPGINLRARILERYKKTEQDSYNIKRQKWAKRITYSGQWAQKDAEKSRSKLYALDELHHKQMVEIDKQIEQFIPLETKPLNCSNEKKAEREKYVRLAVGESKNGGKELSGYLLVRKLGEQKNEYYNKEFLKTANKMMRNQQKAKKKNSKPKQSMTAVDEYKN